MHASIPVSPSPALVTLQTGSVDIYKYARACHVLTCLPAGALANKHRAVAPATIVLGYLPLKVAVFGGLVCITAKESSSK